MKNKSPSRRRQGRKPPRQKTISGPVVIDEKRNFFIRASKTKYGPRSGGKRWHAQLALTEIFKNGLPQQVVNYLELTRKVNEVLKRNPDYNYAN
jgi:hypothetical protein